MLKSYVYSSLLYLSSLYLTVYHNWPTNSCSSNPQTAWNCCWDALTLSPKYHTVSRYYLGSKSHCRKCIFGLQSQHLQDTVRNGQIPGANKFSCCAHFDIGHNVVIWVRGTPHFVISYPLRQLWCLSRALAKWLTFVLRSPMKHVFMKAYISGLSFTRILFYSMRPTYDQRYLAMNLKRSRGELQDGQCIIIPGHVVISMLELLQWPLLTTHRQTQHLFDLFSFYSKYWCS